MFHYSIPVHIVLFHQGKDVYYSTPVHICIISPRRRCLLFHPGTHLYCFTKGEMFIILSRSMIFVVPPKGTSLLFPPGFDTNLIASNTMYIEFSQTRRLSLSPLHKTRRQEMRKRRKNGTKRRDWSRAKRASLVFQMFPRECRRRDLLPLVTSAASSQKFNAYRGA